MPVIQPENITRFAEGLPSSEGEFCQIDGEKFYRIKNAESLRPFFISLVSDSNHWAYISSTGGLTMGRVNPQTSMFPYETVDRIHHSAPHTGPCTLLQVATTDGPLLWEPFLDHPTHAPDMERSLYKNILGNILRFEEVRKDLGLCFWYQWQFSDEFGFVRTSGLRNLNKKKVFIELIDGLQNILPHGVDLWLETNMSCLVDAYKWSEADAKTGLAVYTLYAQIWDKAEPKESLRSTVVWSTGLKDAKILLSSRQIDSFRMGHAVNPENLVRGISGAYIQAAALALEPASETKWYTVAEVSQTQSQVALLRKRLNSPEGLIKDVDASIQKGSRSLNVMMAAADALQESAHPHTTAHHYANVLFNCMRGGLPVKGYSVPVADVLDFVSVRSKTHRTAMELLIGKESTIHYSDLISKAEKSGDSQLYRLALEYMPLTFSRRHGDPSRPWNQFSIEIKDANGNPKLNYQGNWRDIFQNWEALAYSFPEYTESMMAKFLSASTIDGYNPYRVTRTGIDWEEIEPNDVWSYIGYWGDHQIIYLQKFLEASVRFHPEQLRKWFDKQIFAYADVPYEIKPFRDIVGDPKNTITYNHTRHHAIAERSNQMGTDGKLVQDGKGAVMLGSLGEKLLVTWLAKLSNLVLDGGIWLNTQRPEWNDANNALVGNGASMVTLYYLRRFSAFLKDWLATLGDTNFPVAHEVADWTKAIAQTFEKHKSILANPASSTEDRRTLLNELGQAFSVYRSRVYGKGFSAYISMSAKDLINLADISIPYLDHSIRASKRDDGLYQAYNLIDVSAAGKAEIRRLYQMLEGQVSVLSAGVLSPSEVVDVLNALFKSPMYRLDQKSFILYPDRDLPGFFARNQIPVESLAKCELLNKTLEKNDVSLIEKDVDGVVHWNASFANSKDVVAALEKLEGNPAYSALVRQDRAQVLAIYEQVFDHQAFTGRSGTMFGYEGLGSIYWHMVSKLLLAVQENFIWAQQKSASKSVLAELSDLYYRVRLGLSFNKSPEEYGAFPLDPYSHTPSHSGAQQPGMTGQVKEEVLTRWGELGIRIENGELRFDPALLSVKEFLPQEKTVVAIDLSGNETEIKLPSNSLYFSYCGVPVIFELAEVQEIEVEEKQGFRKISGLLLGQTDSRSLFGRDEKIRALHVRFPASLCLG